MKVKRRVIILSSICLIILIGAIILDVKSSKDYFVELKYNEVIEKIENKDSFVLCVSQTTCSHCMEYKPKLKEIANKYKLNIYYIEANLLKPEEEKKIKSYVNYSSTPTTIFIKNGEEKTAASRIEGSTSKDNVIRKLKSNGFIK